MRAAWVGRPASGMETAGIGIPHLQRTHSFQAMEFFTIRSGGVSIRRGWRLGLLTGALATGTGLATIITSDPGIIRPPRLTHTLQREISGTRTM